MRLASKAAIAVFFFVPTVLGQSIDPAQLVKDAVANEIRANEHPTDFWMYRLSKESKSGTQVKDMVETKDLIVARLISLNGRNLTEAERTADDQRLSNLAHDATEQSRKRSDQERESKRFLALVRALPEALIYTYDGSDEVDGRRLIRLKFRPNPSFRTTAIETVIFRAAEGSLWIDEQEKRISKFEGVQTSDINIAWGLLGHIEKGSKLQLEQRRLEQGKWRLTRLDLEGKGQVFIFKSLTLKQRQSASDFHPVPGSLSVAAGIDLLRKQASTVALERTN